MIRIGTPGATFGLKALALAGLAAATLLPTLVSPASADMPNATQLAEMRARMQYRVGVAGLASTGIPPAPQNIVAPPKVVTPAPVTPAPTVNQVYVPNGAHPTGLPANFYYPEAAIGNIHPLEQQMLNLVNAERAKAGLAPLQWDGGLAYIARVRTAQMGQQNYFGHTDPQGYRMWLELINRFGIGYRKAGENLVANGYADADTVRLAVEGLMNSPTHRANILDPGFTKIGLGVYINADGYRYYAQIFQTPAS